MTIILYDGTTIQCSVIQFGLTEKGKLIYDDCNVIDIAEILRITSTKLPEHGPLIFD